MAVAAPVRAVVGVAVAVLLGVGVGACSDEESIEKAELLRRGDEICRQTQQSLQNEIEQSQARGDAAVSETQLIQQVLIPRVRDMFDRIEALGTPDGDGDELGDVYDRIDALLADASSGQAGDFAATYEEILADLRAYGFDDCAQSST